MIAVVLRADHIRCLLSRYRMFQHMPLGLSSCLQVKQVPDFVAYQREIKSRTWIRDTGCCRARTGASWNVVLHRNLWNHVPTSTHSLSTTSFRQLARLIGRSILLLKQSCGGWSTKHCMGSVDAQSGCHRPRPGLRYMHSCPSLGFNTLSSSSGMLCPYVDYVLRRSSACEQSVCTLRRPCARSQESETRHQVLNYTLTRVCY